MKRKLVWTLSLLTASLCAQVAAPPKYKMAAPAHESDIVPLLNGLAEQGYQLVAIGPAAILKLEPPASGMPCNPSCLQSHSRTKSHLM